MAEVSDSWELQMKESDQRFYRTMNELRVEMGLLPVNYSNSMEDQVYDQIILVKIQNLKYSISCRELNMVFSRFGALEKVETLSPRSQFYARICFQNIESARTAIDSLNHRNVYDYCCELELFLMRDIMIEPSNSHPAIMVNIQNDESVCKLESDGIQGLGSFGSDVQGTQNKDTLEDYENPDLSSEKWNWQAVDCLGMENHDADISDIKELEPISVESTMEPDFDSVVDETFRQNLISETILCVGPCEKAKEAGNSNNVLIDQLQENNDRSSFKKGDLKEAKGNPCGVVIQDCKFNNRDSFTRLEYVQRSSSTQAFDLGGDIATVGDWLREYGHAHMGDIAEGQMVDDKCLQALKSEFKVQFEATIEFPSWIGGDQRHFDLLCSEEYFRILSIGGDILGIELKQESITLPYDRGKKALIEEMDLSDCTLKEKDVIPSGTYRTDSEFIDVFYASNWPGKTDDVSVIDVLADFCTIVVDDMILVFDPGGTFDHDRSLFDSSSAEIFVATCLVWDELIWIFDPGIASMNLQVGPLSTFALGSSENQPSSICCQQTYKSSIVVAAKKRRLQWDPGGSCLQPVKWQGCEIITEKLLCAEEGKRELVLNTKFS